MIPAQQPDANCERCGAPMRLAAKRNEKSAPFKLAKVPKGVCANCVVTQFLYNTYPINMQLDEAGPELLLKPGIRDAFLMCGILDDCDLKIDEIDWQTIVRNWTLPVEVKRGDKNPYSMGDAKRRREEEAADAHASQEFEDALAEYIGGADKEKQDSVRKQVREQMRPPVSFFTGGKPQ